VSYFYYSSAIATNSFNKQRTSVIVLLDDLVCSPVSTGWGFIRFTILLWISAIICYISCYFGNNNFSNWRYMQLKSLNSNRWTKEECRKKYIEDFKISLKAISVLSRVPKPTLEKWSKEGNWVADKKEYHKNPDINKADQELSDIASRNYKVHSQLLNYAAKILQYKMSDLSKVDSMSSDERLDYLKLEHDPHEIDAWSRIIFRATEAISKITGLQYYSDVNAAIKRIEKEGLGVIDLSLIQDTPDEE
jgi:hypothetical protein